jgi:hypothetical protein
MTLLRFFWNFVGSHDQALMGIQEKQRMEEEVVCLALSKSDV